MEMVVGFCQPLVSSDHKCRTIVMISAARCLKRRKTTFISAEGIGFKAVRRRVAKVVFHRGSEKPRPYFVHPALQRRKMGVAIIRKDHQACVWHKGHAVSDNRM